MIPASQGSSNDVHAAYRLRNPEGRRRRAARILRVLEDFAGPPLATAALLDVGAGHGIIASTLAESVGWAVGIDVDAAAVATARADPGVSVRLDLAVASGMQLPLRDGCMDLVVCNHVYEHVGDAPMLLREIARVLRPGGACYFAGGHRLQLIEPHYRLPLLSWLPQAWADRYLRATGRGSKYEESFLPPWRLRSLFAPFGSARDVTGDVLRSCHRYGLGPRWLQGILGVLLPGPLARLAGWTLPTHLWILHK